MAKQVYDDADRDYDGTTQADYKEEAYEEEAGGADAQEELQEDEADNADGEVAEEKVEEDEAANEDGEAAAEEPEEAEAAAEAGNVAAENGEAGGAYDETVVAGEITTVEDETEGADAETTRQEIADLFNANKDNDGDGFYDEMTGDEVAAAEGIDNKEVSE